MDPRIDTLEQMLDAFAHQVGSVGPSELSLATPCAAYDVAALLDHAAVWIQVFDGAVNETGVDFDPLTHHIAEGHADIVRTASAGILRGLRERGIDRPITMMANPMPGEFILNMLLMEYVGHGWDLAKATGRPHGFTDEHAVAALVAAEAILAPEYRGSGMFDHAVAVPDDAPAIDRYVAFIGRDPGWAGTAGTTSN